MRRSPPRRRKRCPRRSRMRPITRPRRSPTSQEEVFLELLGQRYQCEVGALPRYFPLVARASGRTEASQVHVRSGLPCPVTSRSHNERHGILPLGTHDFCRTRTQSTAMVVWLVSVEPEPSRGIALGAPRPFLDARPLLPAAQLERSVTYVAGPLCQGRCRVTSIERDRRGERAARRRRCSARSRPWSAAGSAGSPSSATSRSSGRRWRASGRSRR